MTLFPTYSLIEDQAVSTLYSKIYASGPCNVELQRRNTENVKRIFPEKELQGLKTNFHSHVSVIKLYTPTIGLSILQ